MHVKESNCNSIIEKLCLKLHRLLLFLSEYATQLGGLTIIKMLGKCWIERLETITFTMHNQTYSTLFTL